VRKKAGRGINKTEHDHKSSTYRSRKGIVDAESMPTEFMMTLDAKRSEVVNISQNITSGAWEKSFARGEAEWFAGGGRDPEETDDESDGAGEIRFGG
jgi:hypothetical protein